MHKLAPELSPEKISIINKLASTKRRFSLVMRTYSDCYESGGTLCSLHFASTPKQTMRHSLTSTSYSLPNQPDDH